MREIIKIDHLEGAYFWKRGKKYGPVHVLKCPDFIVMDLEATELYKPKPPKPKRRFEVPIFQESSGNCHIRLFGAHVDQSDMGIHWRIIISASVIHSYRENIVSAIPFGDLTCYVKAANHDGWRPAFKSWGPSSGDYGGPYGDPA